MFKKLRRRSIDAAEPASRDLMQPLLLEQGRAPRVFANLLALGSALVAAFVLWASITKIDELTIAPGEIRPVGSVQTVHHLEGGMVLEILVREGAIVDQGAPLVRLQPVAARSDLDQLKSRHANLTLQKIRLEAEIAGRKPDFDDFKKTHPGLTREQAALYRRSLEQAAKERETLIARIEQKDADVDNFTKQSESLERQVQIQAEQLKIRADLLKEGLVSKAAFLEVKRMHERIRGEMLGMRGQLKTGLEALNEARIALLELDANTQKKRGEERAKTVAELTELAQTIAKHEDRVKRLLVRAASRGIVQELVPKAVGEVLKPGDVVAKIVPLGQELVAEVQVPPGDIGHIKVGHRADVKITTYDAAKFGAVKGVVRKLSASTFHTEKGEPYFKAEIALQHNYVGARAQRRMILPGMVVNAEIVTGAKSLTRYLLKPVYRSLDVAFSER